MHGGLGYYHVQHRQGRQEQQPERSLPLFPADAVGGHDRHEDPERQGEQETERFKDPVPGAQVGSQDENAVSEETDEDARREDSQPLVGGTPRQAAHFAGHEGQRRHSQPRSHHQAPGRQADARNTKFRPRNPPFVPVNRRT